MKRIDPALCALLNGLEIAGEQEDEVKRKLFALAMVWGYLRSIGVDHVLLQPIEDLWHSHFDEVERRIHGGAVRPITETMELARAAAMVTHFAAEMNWTVDRALDAVSSLWPVDRETVKKFRNHVHRPSRANKRDVECYRGYVATFAIKAREGGM